MSQLVLVKHSLPRIEPGKPASEWILSGAGRKRCFELAERLTQYMPQNVISSSEPKARQTAAILSRRLGPRYEVIEGLHEHERRSVPIVSQEEYRAAAASLFQSPEDLVFGEETALQAGERFSLALNPVLEASNGTTVIVSHGTVISLFVAKHNRLDPLELWKQLGLPSYLVLSRPELQLLEVVTEV